MKSTYFCFLSLSSNSSSTSTIFCVVLQLGTMGSEPISAVLGEGRGGAERGGLTLNLGSAQPQLVSLEGRQAGPLRSTSQQLLLQVFSFIYLLEFFFPFSFFSIHFSHPVSLVSLFCPSFDLFLFIKAFAFNV